MEALIESVRRYPSLWQVRSKAYKDLKVKENAWKKVSEGLRDKFVRELKRGKHRFITGQSCACSCVHGIYV